MVPILAAAGLPDLVQRRLLSVRETDAGRLAVIKDLEKEIKDLESKIDQARTRIESLSRK